MSLIVCLLPISSSFPFCNRIIGQRWKNIDPDRLSKFSELAATDTERYKTEMQAYNGKQEAKMRSELKAAPAPYSGVPSATGSVADRSTQQYPDLRTVGLYGSGSSGYETPAYAPTSMGGYANYSDYSGYGMGLSGYVMPEGKRGKTSFILRGVLTPL